MVDCSTEMTSSSAWVSVNYQGQLPAEMHSKKSMCQDNQEEAT